MKPSLNLEELRNVANGKRSDGFAGIARMEDDARAAANTAISLMQAAICNEEEIKQLEADNRAACARIAELEAMVGRVERAAGL